MRLQPNYSYLKQSHWLFGTREFIVRSTEAILVREHSFLRKHETLVPLKLLQENPSYASSFAMKWLFNCLFAAALALILSYMASHYQIIAIYIPAAVMVITALAFLYRFLMHTTRLTVFRHRHTNENFLYFWQDKPDRKQFSNFIARLNALIAAQQE